MRGRLIPVPIKTRHLLFFDIRIRLHHQRRWRMRLMLNPLTVIGFLPVDDDQSGVESAAVGSCSRSAGNESLFAEQIKHDRPEKTMRGFATRAGDVAEFMARGIIRSNPPLRRGAGSIPARANQFERRCPRGAATTSGRCPLTAGRSCPLDSVYGRSTQAVKADSASRAAESEKSGLARGFESHLRPTSSSGEQKGSIVAKAPSPESRSFRSI